MIHLHPKKLTIDILVLIELKNVELFKKLELYWRRYLNINVIYDVPENIANYTNKKIHVLFLEAAKYKLFNLDFYRTWQILNQGFMYVSVSEKRKTTDIDIYKALADQVIYLNEQLPLIEWNSFAILRRYWNVSSNNSTIIYRDVIADFDEHVIYINQEALELSKKEYEVLKLLILHRGTYVHKGLISKKVWNQEKQEHGSRTLDQVLQRIRTKVGENRITVKRSIGVRFE